MVIIQIMIPLCFVFTLVLWMYRERQFHKERMEMLKLIKASSLSDFAAENKKAPEKTNFTRDSIRQAYKAQAEREPLPINGEDDE